MEDQDSYYGDRNSDHVRWLYYDEQSAGWKNYFSWCMGVPYSVFLLWSKDNQGKQVACGRSVKMSDKITKKREREKKMVSLMIKLYCNKKHHTGKHLCDACTQLNEYAIMRSDKCPFMETKTFCSNCKVHCYKPDMREQIKEVMRFSGPRMIFRHPVAAIRHVVESKREKKRLDF